MTTTEDRSSDGSGSASDGRIDMTLVVVTMVAELPGRSYPGE
jgi:hypothetical protein